MSESYKCGKCGGQRFSVVTFIAQSTAVLVVCAACDAHATEDTVAEAFQAIAKPMEKEETK